MYDDLEGLARSSHREGAHADLASIIENLANKLTKMQWAVEHISSGGTTPNVRTQIDKLQSEIDGGQDLLKKMGSLMPQSESGVEVVEFGRGCWEHILHAPQMPFDAVGFTYRYHLNGPALILADKEQLIGAIVHLTQRARRATVEKKQNLDNSSTYNPLIELEVDIQDADGLPASSIVAPHRKHLRITVADNGTGAPAETSGHRALSGDLGASKDLGSIKSMACALGGNLEVAPRRRGGTTATLSLPILPAGNGR